jgi:hypothetical protein
MNAEPTRWQRGVSRRRRHTIARWIVRTWLFLPLPLVMLLAWTLLTRN